eukprot:CAMPEP_0183402674 /NCGR_PEP_ID=MMETSP0370-20130417/14066_1 /TAXON_ID=268820 /ORGANISM="Peridinium aciculiferum, Strain PAER-2" /LENGTH=171 /DNA_ID=CAMNT_0025584309 /DNA_START=24 /DNA_END=540 /DNA_ORIENTATION=+
MCLSFTGTGGPQGGTTKIKLLSHMPLASNPIAARPTARPSTHPTIEGAIGSAPTLGTVGPAREKCPGRVRCCKWTLPYVAHCQAQARTAHEGRAAWGAAKVPRCPLRASSLQTSSSVAAQEWVRLLGGAGEAFGGGVPIEPHRENRAERGKERCQGEHVPEKLGCEHCLFW